MYQTLKDKIDRNTARVGIIGLGYVGLPLAVEFAKRVSPSPASR
jgi:UDP-N-acetyl-D-mannosaminuronate dehydrogenase